MTSFDMTLTISTLVINTTDEFHEKMTDAAMETYLAVVDEKLKDTIDSLQKLLGPNFEVGRSDTI